MPGPFHQALSDIALGLGVAVEVFALALIPLVMLRRKEPSSTFAWILTLVFLPGLGAVLFLLHGRDRVRWPARRKRAADAVLETRLEHVRRETRVDPSAAVDDMDENERRIFRVCRALGPLVEVSDGNKVELYSAGQCRAGRHRGRHRRGGEDRLRRVLPDPERRNGCALSRQARGCRCAGRRRAAPDRCLRLLLAIQALVFPAAQGGRQGRPVPAAGKWR